MSTSDNWPVGFDPALKQQLLDVGWGEVELFDSLGSTNSYSATSPTAWRLVAADDQNAGRGRLDRTWQATAGESVAVSMTVPLPATTSDWGWVPLFVGVAVLKGVRSLISHDDAIAVGLKWPNDALVTEGARTGKLAGILCQALAGPPALVVAGVGINVAQGVDALATEQATSLRAAGCDVARDEVLVAVAREFLGVARSWNNADGVRELKAEVRENCVSIGRDVEVHTAQGEVRREKAVAIDDEGRLVTEPLPTGIPNAAERTAYAVADIVHMRTEA